MAHDSRIGTSGLGTYPSTNGIKPNYLDGQEWRFQIQAIATFLATMLGGEGIFWGGAVDETELGGSGTTYPVVMAIIDDDGSPAYPWFIVTTSNLAITFNATDTAAGEGRLYMKVKARTGDATAALGGPADVEFIADDVAEDAPDHALLLGAGTITSSAFASYTESVSRPNLLRLAVPSSSTAPTPVVDGQMYYDTDTNIGYVYNGTSWDAMNAGP